jgi:hypothetical protein
MTLLPILQLAAQGCRLFPIRARAKTPLIKDWPNQASESDAHIGSWAKNWQACNWGMATGAGSRIFVLDFDGVKGQASFRDLIETHGKEWTKTRTVRTPQRFSSLVLVARKRCGRSQQCRENCAGSGCPSRRRLCSGSAKHPSMR